MAQPSSSHHGERHHRSDRERERERERSHSHHHHRTISSTTLLLVLSLILAVLAVMLSLPSGQGTSTDSLGTGVLGYLTPKRTQALIARESAVAQREAEVARREAEILAGAAGGVIPSVPSPIVCPVCSVTTVTETVAAPIQTVIKEVIQEASLTPPGWTSPRAEEILERELKIAEREREIGKREESVNRREHDAARREAWIMDQLHALGNNDYPQHVEEEYVYEQPVGSKRKAKYQELPPIVSEISYETQTRTVVQTQTVTVPPPANTRHVAQPRPEGVATSPSTVGGPRTTAFDIIEEEDSYRTVRKPRPTQQPPSRWFGGW